MLYLANPKNLAVGLSAAVAFASGHLSTESAIIVAAIYLFVSASTIVIPILGYLILQKKIRPWLAELQAGMTQHNAAMMAALLFVLGAMMIGKGIAAA